MRKANNDNVNRSNNTALPHQHLNTIRLEKVDVKCGHQG